MRKRLQTQGAAPRFLWILAVFALVAAACTGSGADTSTTAAGQPEDSTTTTPDATTTTTEQTDSTEGPSGTLTILWPDSAPTTMDDQNHRTRNNQIVQHLMRDKLFLLTPPGLEPQPHIAESLERIDELTWEVKIRPGVLFHSGHELTAEDVAFTFNRIIDQEVSDRYNYGSLPLLESVVAVDQYTARFMTSDDIGALGTVALNLAGVELQHKETYEPLYHDLEELAVKPPNGAGPFQYVDWVEGQYIEMEAFPDYWGGTPGVEKLIIRTVPEEATRIAELLAGSANMIFLVSPDFIPQLETAGMKIASAPGTSLRMISMNVREGSPFADVATRRAVYQAIDRSVIVDNLFSGYGSPEYGIAFTGQEGHDPDLKPFEYDPDAAREVLSQINQPINAIADITRIEQAGVDAVVEQLRSVGLELDVMPLDRAAFLEAQEAGDFDIAFHTMAAGSGQFLGTNYQGEWWCERDHVRTGFCDEALDELHLQGLTAATVEARREIARQVVRELTETHVTQVPLYNVDNLWALRPEVQGFEPSSAGQLFNMHRVWIEE